MKTTLWKHFHIMHYVISELFYMVIVTEDIMDVNNLSPVTLKYSISIKQGDECVSYEAEHIILYFVFLCSKHASFPFV